jgi:hypothetical protein
MEQTKSHTKLRHLLKNNKWKCNLTSLATISAKDNHPQPKTAQPSSLSLLLMIAMDTKHTTQPQQALG